MASQGVVPAAQAQPIGAKVVLPALAAPPKERKHRKHQTKKKPKSIKDMITKEFGKNADEALRIAFCESRFDPDDVSSAGAVGVFQIRTADHGWRVKKIKHGKDLFDPWTNVQVAHDIFKHQGWRPWVCARIVGLSAGSGMVHRVTPSVTTWSPNEGRRAPREPRQPGGTMSAWQ